MGEQRDMRILIYGAGVIGSLYGAYLSRSGCDVAVLARGQSLAELMENGLLYKQGNAILRANVSILETLESSDQYDYIFLTVRSGQIQPALEALRENISPTIVTMVNTLEAYSYWEDICVPALHKKNVRHREGYVKWHMLHQVQCLLLHNAA